MDHVSYAKSLDKLRTCHIGDAQLADLTLGRTGTDGANGWNSPVSKAHYDRLLAIALGDDRLLPNGETTIAAITALLDTCWGEGYSGDPTDMNAAMSHLLIEIGRTCGCGFPWTVAIECLDLPDAEKKLHCADLSENARAMVDGAMAGIASQQHQRQQRAAYHDPTFPPRQCSHCGLTYTGPAVYCSLACALKAA
jgi:hypothetical protein